MWFYNSNNQEKKDMGKEVVVESAQPSSREKQTPSHVQESVNDTAKWFERMVERDSVSSDRVVVTPPDTMPPISSMSSSNTMPSMLPRTEGSMTSLYPAISDPTEETQESKRSAEMISKQIDGEGYWVADMPTPNSSIERDDLAAIDTGYAEPETVG